MRVRDARQTFLGHLAQGRAARASEFEIWGDGEQRRDLLYVDDAVRAFLLAGAREEADGEVFNVGGRTSVTLRELAETLVARRRRGASYRLVPFPAERKAIDIGDYYADGGKIREALGWSATVALAEGLRRTLDYYREHGEALLVRRESRSSTSRGEVAGAPAGARRGDRRRAGRAAVRARRAGGGVRDGVRGVLRRAEAVGVASGTDAIDDRAPGGRRRAGRRGRSSRRTRASRRSPGVEAAGAVPVLADVDPRTWTLDPASARGRASPSGRARSCRCTSTGSAPTSTRSRELGLKVVEDAAQAHGAACAAAAPAPSATPRRSASTRRRTSARSATAARSSRATPQVAARARALRSIRRARALRVGAERLEQPPRRAPGGDPARQAAAARRRGTQRRREIAARYDALGLERQARAGRVPACLPPLRRPLAATATRCAQRLAGRGIETLVHYPRAVHQHPGYAHLARPGLEESERLAAEVLSLPLYPELRRRRGRGGRRGGRR